MVIKLYGERIIKKYSDKTVTQFTILRLFNILGGKMLNTGNSSVLSYGDKIKKIKKLLSMIMANV